MTVPKIRARIWLPAYVASLVCSAGAADAPMPAVSAAMLRDSQHDFDFLFGRGAHRCMKLALAA